MSSTKTTDSLFSAYKPKPIVEPTTTIVAPTTPKSTDPSLFEDTTAPIVNPSLYSDEGLGVNPPVTSDNYTDHMNSMAQANAQVDANGNPVYATYSYNPQNNTYTADYSAFGLTGDYATETFTSEQFLADNNRTFASMEGYGTSNEYTDHINSMAQANAQVDANGNPVYATYSYDPQSDTYTADYSAFGLTGDSATETFTSEQFLADNNRTFASMEGYGTNNEYTDHMNSMAQANAQVDANGNPVYATYSYDPQNDTYTADYSAFGLTGDYATETFTSEQFLADNDRTFASMEGYEPLGPTLYYVEEDLNGGLISAPIYDTRMESEKSTDGLLEEKEEEETDAVDPSLYSDEGLGVNPLLEEERRRRRRRRRRVDTA